MVQKQFNVSTFQETTYFLGESWVDRKIFSNRIFIFTCCYVGLFILLDKLAPSICWPEYSFDPSIEALTVRMLLDTHREVRSGAKLSSVVPTITLIDALIEEHDAIDSKPFLVLPWSFINSN